MRSCRGPAQSQRGRNTGSRKITRAAAYCRDTLAAEVQPVIADPNSSVTTEQEPTRALALVERSPLTPNELYQLTLYKWRYSLEAFGFQEREVRELMFLKWLHASHHLVP